MRGGSLTARSSLLALALGVLPSLAWAEPFPTSPLRATIFFRNPPPGVVFHPTSLDTPVTIVLHIENVSGARIITTEGFPAKEHERRLVFTAPNGGQVKNATVHENPPLGYCFSRQRVLIVPRALSVVPAEILSGAPSTQVPTPGAPTLTAGGAGALPSGTYFYRVTAFDAFGVEGAAGPEAAVAVVGPPGAVALSWLAVPGATGYRVYRGTTPGGQNRYYTSAINSFTDTGAAARVAPPPPFALEYVIPDARAPGFYDLSAEGRYRVKAVIPIQTFTTTIRDCDQAEGDVVELARGQDGTVESNTLEFFIASDTTPPTTTAERSPAPNGAGWNNRDARLSFTATDDAAGSGVKRLFVSTAGAQTGEHVFPHLAAGIVTGDVTIQMEGTTTARYRAEDNAGNLEPQQSREVKLDKSPPTITLAPASGASFTLNQTVTVTFGATDQPPSPVGSGLASVQGTIQLPGSTPAPLTSGQAVTLTKVGTTEATVTARDVADNTGTATAQYFVRYAFVGFLPPIVNDSECSSPPCQTVRRGSTVPVKFQLFDALDAVVRNAVARIRLGRVGDVPLDATVVDLGTGSANTGDLFQFDSIGNQYLFNLDTRALQRGTWKIEAVLDDGRTIHPSVLIGVR